MSETIAIGRIWINDAREHCGPYTSEGSSLRRTHKFNQPLNDANDWDVISVTDMWGMFNYSLAFNQPLMIAQ